MLKRTGNHIIQQWWASRHNPFFKKLTTVLGGDILAKVSGFLLIPLYLRLMTQEEYGLYNYFASIIQTLGLTLTLGLYVPQIKLYHSIKTAAERGRMLFTICITLGCFIVFFILPFFIFGIYYALAGRFFTNPVAYGRYRLLLLLALVVTLLGFILTYYLFASERIRQIKIYNRLRILFLILTAFSLFIFRDDTVRYRLLFTYASELLLILFFSKYLIREVVPGFSGKVLIKSLGIGLPIMFSTVFGLIVNFSDKFYLEKYGDLKHLSCYYLAFTFASILSLIAASLQNVWMPHFMKEADLKKNSENTRKLLLRMLVAFIVLGLGIWIFFEVLLRLDVIPPKYADATLVLPLLLVSQIFMAVVSILSNYLIYFEKTYLLLIAGLIVSLESIGLSRILIPQYGMFGAAVSVLISTFIYLLICYYLVRTSKTRFLQKQVAADMVSV